MEKAEYWLTLFSSSMKDRLTSLKKSENKGTQELVQDPIDSLEEIKKSFRRNVYKDDMDQFFWVKKYDKLQRGDNFVDAEGKGNVFCFVLFWFGMSEHSLSKRLRERTVKKWQLKNGNGHIFVQALIVALCSPIGSLPLFQLVVSCGDRGQYRTPCPQPVPMKVSAMFLTLTTSRWDYFLSNGALHI